MITDYYVKIGGVEEFKEQNIEGDMRDWGFDWTTGEAVGGWRMLNTHDPNEVPAWFV